MRNLILLLLVMPWALTAQASIHFTESATLDWACPADEIVYVSGQGTTLTIVDGGWACELWAEDLSRVDLLGGSIDTLCSRSRSTSMLYGGSVGNIDIGGGIVNNYGGTNSGVFLSGGVFYQYEGASLGSIHATGRSGVVILSGILPEVITAENTARLEFAGYEFSQTPYSDTGTTLSGKNVYGESFSVDVELLDSATLRTTVTTVIPEPVSAWVWIGLIGAGIATVVVRRRRKETAPV